MEKPRQDGLGGRIAVLHQQTIETSTISIAAPTSFKHIAFKPSGPKPVVTAVIYHPPKPNPAFPSDSSEF